MLKPYLHQLRLAGQRRNRQHAIDHLAHVERSGVTPYTDWAPWRDQRIPLIISSKTGRFRIRPWDLTKLLDMEIIRTPIEGLIIFRPTPIRDEWGNSPRIASGAG